MRTLHYQLKYLQDRIRYWREQFSISLSTVTPQMSLDGYLLFDSVMNKQCLGRKDYCEMIHSSIHDKVIYKSYCISD